MIMFDTSVGAPLFDLALVPLDREVIDSKTVGLTSSEELPTRRKGISSHAIKAINLSFYLHSLYEGRTNIGPGKSKTVIAEVGPGIGLPPLNLRQRFKNNIKYYLIDINNTLQLSFYLLSATFPELRHVVLNKETNRSSLESSYFVYVTPDNVSLIDDDLDYVINCNSFPIRTLLPDMKHLMTEEERKLASRRQAIEPIIGHLKSDHRLDRCYLKGQTGDAIHAVLCAAGYNIKWLMRMILQKGIKPFLFLFCAQEIRALFENLKQIPARFQTNPINHHLRAA